MAIELDRAEALRYMRMGNSTPDAEFLRRFDSVAAEVMSVIRPAAYWQLVPVEFTSETSYRVGSLELASTSLRRQLEGCRHAFLFVGTLGAGVDALLRRFAHRSAADLLMVQAMSAALIETWCDECECKMLAEPAVAGESLRFRFAPGYGDLPIEVQKPLLMVLDSGRRAGITLTDSMLMIPSKSISAIIGVGPAAEVPRKHDCSLCTKTDCEFRRVGK